VEKRPNPATAHTQSQQRGAQTTSRSSALVRGRSTQLIANPCRWPQRPCSEMRLHFCHFPAVFWNAVLLVVASEACELLCLGTCWRCMLIPKQSSSQQVWEERVDKTRIITTEGLTTCLDPGRGWTINSEGWNFLKKQECWEGHEQALIATIRKETERTEELRKLDTDHQRGQYYEHCSRTIVPRELKETQRCLPLLSFSRRDEKIYSSRGGKKDQR